MNSAGRLWQRWDLHSCPLVGIVAIAMAWKNMGMSINTVNLTVIFRCAMKIATIFMIIILSNHLDGHSCPSASNSWSLMKELYSVMITTWIWILICFWFLSWSKFSTAETELFISNQARSKVDIVTIIKWLRILDLVQSKEWLCNIRFPKTS